jgi:hypothetical protein
MLKGADTGLLIALTRFKRRIDSIIATNLALKKSVQQAEGRSSLASLRSHQQI